MCEILQFKFKSIDCGSKSFILQLCQLWQEVRTWKQWRIWTTWI